ncbi:MAG TPA: ABC transporter substrate-binding protein [bacterium]|nr:ABC transporter substrate-binding protein [bacterium]
MVIAVGCIAAVACLLAYAPGTAAFTGSPVHIGMLGPFTGPRSDLGAAIIQGTKVAQAAINDAGGVLGRELTLDSADTIGDAADAVPAINKLIGAGHVVAIIGPETAEYFAVRPIFTRSKIPDEMQGGDVSLDHEPNAFFWRDSPSDSVLSVAMALYAWKLGYKTAATMMYTEESAQTLKPPLIKTFQKLGGKIVADVNIQGGQTSYRSEVLKLISAHPQVIFTQTDPATAAVLFANFKQLNNLAIPFIGTDLTGGDDYLKAVTYAAAHDHLISVYGTSVTGKGNDVFAKYYGKLYPGKEPLANANYAYDAAVSVALAIDKAGSTDGAKINAAMISVTNPPGTKCYAYADCLKLLKAGSKINYEGASGSLDYNKFHNVFGPYGAFRVDMQGKEQQITLMSEADLAKAAP